MVVQALDNTKADHGEELRYLGSEDIHPFERRNEIANLERCGEKVAAK